MYGFAIDWGDCFDNVGWAWWEVRSLVWDRLNLRCFLGLEMVVGFIDLELQWRGPDRGGLCGSHQCPNVTFRATKRLWDQQGQGIEGNGLVRKSMPGSLPLSQRWGEVHCFGLLATALNWISQPGPGGAESVLQHLRSWVGNLLKYVSCCFQVFLELCFPSLNTFWVEIVAC